MDIEELSNSGVSEHTGFPNAATDARLSALDLGKLLVKHPSSTFYMRVASEAYRSIGIYAGDILVVDRALEPKKSDLVVYWDNESFAISKVHKLNSETSPWGIVTHNIHNYRNLEKS